MKKTIKKLLASLLTFAMLVSLMPLAAMAEDAVDTSFVFGTGTYGSFRSQGISGVQLGGIGGKAEDDMAMAFVVDSDFNGQESRWQYPITHIDDNSVGNTGGGLGIYYSFNIYADGETTASVGYGSKLNAVFTWEKDGTVTYGNDKLITNMERGKWHKIVVSQAEDSGRRLTLFIDGVQLAGFADAGWTTWNPGKNPLLFGIPANCGTGTVAFDDPYITLWNSGNKYGKIVSQDTLTPADSETIDFDNDAKSLIYHYSIADTSALADAIKTACSASEVTICDENLSVTANLENAEYAVIKNQANAYHYYSVSQLEKPAMENVQLEKEADDSSTADDNWKTNVKLYDDVVAVYSHNENPTWQITSNNLISALSSKTGYELSYVDDNKETAVTNHVTGGYIKAVKDGETLYIPIVKQYNCSEGFQTTVEANVNVRYRNAYGHTPTSASNVAGNPASAFGFSVKSGSKSDDRYDIYMISNAADANSFVTNRTCTYVFNMYADGDAILVVGSRKGGAKLFEWNPDGSVYVSRWVNGSAVKDETPFMNLERGQWHQVAFTIDRASSRGELYIDGIHYEHPELFPVWNYCTGISLCMGKLAEGYAADATGRVLFSDIEYYEGFYYNYGETVVANSSTTDFVMDADDNIIYYQNMDAAALKAAILDNTDAKAVRIFEDATIANETETLTENSIVVLTSANGMRYDHFTLKSYSEIPVPEITIKPYSTVFDVTTKIVAPLEDVVYYVATYAATGKLVSVKSVPVTDDMIGIETTERYAYGDGGVSVKVFILKNGIAPFAYAEYIPEA